jgi:hypothetical protein
LLVVRTQFRRALPHRVRGGSRRKGVVRRYGSEPREINFYVNILYFTYRRLPHCKYYVNPLYLWWTHCKYYVNPKNTLCKH